MGRKPCCSKEEGLNIGAWTAIEHKILIDYFSAHGEGKWRSLPKAAGLKRCGKSCRLRWLNYLRPDIKRGNLSHDEDLIIRFHKLLGNRWSLIAGRLPGRTDNEIKNYWNTVLSKRAQEKEFDHTNYKYEKKQRIISWSRKAPTDSGGVIHAKAEERCTKVFITPQQQITIANDDSNVIHTVPSIDAKLVHETAAVESESSDGSFTLLSSKEENPSSNFIMDFGIGEISSISEVHASDDFKQLRDFDLCDMNTTGIYEYGTNDCGQALWSPEGMVENWSVNDCVELEANLDSDFGFLAAFLDQSTKDLTI